MYTQALSLQHALLEFDPSMTTPWSKNDSRSGTLGEYSQVNLLIKLYITHVAP